MPTMMLVMNFVGILIVWVGAHRIAASSMQVGDMMAYLQICDGRHLFVPDALDDVYHYSARGGFGPSVSPRFSQPRSSIRDPDHAEHIDPALRGLVEFRDVTFRYSGAEDDVLHSVSFVARPGETTAIIGATGSGKSTLVNLIPRFYDVSGGTVLVGGG